LSGYGPCILYPGLPINLYSHRTQQLDFHLKQPKNSKKLRNVHTEPGLLKLKSA
jgi:uncharacterized FAD-dependent dehydrogenase